MKYPKQQLIFHRSTYPNLIGDSASWEFSTVIEALKSYRVIDDFKVYFKYGRLEGLMRSYKPKLEYSSLVSRQICQGIPGQDLALAVKGGIHNL